MKYKFETYPERKYLKTFAHSLMKFSKEVQKEPFFTAPENTAYLKNLKINVSKVQKSFDIIVLIGIGASSLAAKSIYSALRNKAKKIMLFAESTDPEQIKEILNATKNRKTLYLVISDSGRTLETIANFSVLTRAKNNSQFAAITQKYSPLWNYAGSKKWPVFEMAENIHGRFSMFASTGLVPLALAGISIDKLAYGAMIANRDFIKSPKTHTAFLSAQEIYANYNDGRKIHNLFLFDPHLEDLGKWWRQLTAESLGKNGKGMTPIVSIGSVDLHSMFQLYIDGPKDKLTTFLEINKQNADYPVPENVLLRIKKTSLSRIEKSLFKASYETYKKRKLPLMRMILPAINEEALGYFVQTKLIETYLLAKLLKLNPFNQPAVELYKKRALELLKK